MGPAHDPNTVTSPTDRYMIVSADSHVGPLVEEQLREYCPGPRLDDFDEFVRLWEPTKRPTWDDDGPYFKGTSFTDKVRQRTAETTSTDGVFDPPHTSAATWTPTGSRPRSSTTGR